MLLPARMLYRDIHKLDSDSNDLIIKRKSALTRIFWIYIAFASLSMLGYAHFQLISYHLKSASIMQDTQISIAFAIAMGIDALAALLVGRLFDRAGFITLAIIPILSIPIAPLVFSLHYDLALISIILWGAVMGMQETIMLASIA